MKKSDIPSKNNLALPDLDEFKLFIQFADKDGLFFLLPQDTLKSLK